MALYWWDRLNISGNGITGPMCSDGTHVYFEIRDNAAAHTLYKFEIASKTVVATAAIAGNANYHGPICTDGTHILIATSNGPRAFLCSNLTDQGVVIANANIGNINGDSGGEGYYDGTYFWFGGIGDPNQINRITPGSWAVTSYGSTANHSIAVNSIAGIGSDLLVWSTTIIYGPTRTTKAGTVVWKGAVGGGAPGGANGAVYDVVRDEVWYTDGNSEVVCLDGTTGGFIDRTGTSQATWTLSAIRPATDGDSVFANGTGVGLIGGAIIVGSVATNPGQVQRRNTEVPRYSAGLWSSLGTYPGTPRPLRFYLAVGNTVYASPSANAVFGWTGPVWLDYTDYVAPVSANLTDVTPMTGPVLRLGFDTAVGITGPTITGPADGLGVTGATQFSATEIDLACAIRPDHPDGDADNATLVPPIGEADPLGPPVPTGVGATVI